MYLSPLVETMRATARLYNNGKVTIPAQIRAALGINDGDLVEINVKQIDRGQNND